MLRRLLVPLDGSAFAEAVLPWTVHLAREKRLMLTLARVVRGPMRRDGPDAAARPGDGTLTDADYDAARAYLDALRGRLVRQGVEADVAVREGTPADALLDLADQINASAIVLATHGPKRTGGHSLGSVAEQIVQEATVPVLLLPAAVPDPDRPPSLRRLLVPLDGSPLAERALDVARELTIEGTCLLLVRVVEPVAETLDTAEGSLPLEDAALTRCAVAEATSYLNAARHMAGGDGIAVGTSVPIGAPDRQILASAREHAVDLIVMVTHGSTGPARWWLGSVANEVARRAECPVLLVSARALVARVARGYRVGDVMTRELVAVRLDETLDVVLRRLLRRRISGAPVVGADGTLVGVITEHDLLRWRAGAEGAPRSLQDARAGDVMSHLAVSVEESVPLATAVTMLLELPYRRLPVTRHRRLVGILSRADVLKALAEQDTVPAEAALAEAALAGTTGG